VWSLSPAEKFDEAMCKAGDLSPCTTAHGVNMAAYSKQQINFNSFS
jgi:hypothetical protein